MLLTEEDKRSSPNDTTNQKTELQAIHLALQDSALEVT